MSQTYHLPLLIECQNVHRARIICGKICRRPGMVKFLLDENDGTLEYSDTHGSYLSMP